MGKDSRETWDRDEDTVPISEPQEDFKHFVQDLYEDGGIVDNDEHSREIFSKETFVITEEDLEMVNHDVQHMLNQDVQEVLDEDVQDLNQFDYNDDYDPDRSFYDDQDENLPVEEVVIDSSDGEFDDTHFMYDPPGKYKDRFLIYLLKASPLLILLVAVYLYASDFKNGDLPSIFGSSHPSPYINHKIYVLEEEINSLKKLKNLDAKVDTISSEIAIIKQYIENLQHNPELENKGQQVAEKLGTLESSIADISDKIESIDVSVHTPEQVTSTVVQKPVIHDATNKIVNKFYNIANKCSVVRKLTSVPWRVRRRKTVKDRIIYGFPDFFNRVWNNHSKTNSVKSLAGINLLSGSNHPKNALLDSPNKFWQIQASNMPVYYTVNIDEPISLHEVGIYHSRHVPNVSGSIDADLRKRWFKCAPQNIEVLVRPIDSDVTSMKDSMKKYYNQDLKFNKKMVARGGKELENWVRLGTVKYDVNSNNAYQDFKWSASIKTEISKFRVKELMIVVHSNWGDEIVVLDTLRIFENSVSELDGYYDEDIDDVGYLGEESV